jgi:hypothetical protein
MKIKLRGLKAGNAAPNQLKVEKGKLIAADGTKADFSLMPDGDYNVVPRSTFETLRTQAMCFRNFGS